MKVCFFDQKYSKSSNIVKFFNYFIIFLNVTYSYDVKAEFLASLLQSSVSHDIQKSF